MFIIRKRFGYNGSEKQQIQQNVLNLVIMDIVDIGQQQQIQQNLLKYMVMDIMMI